MSICSTCQGEGCGPQKTEQGKSVYVGLFWAEKDEGGKAKKQKDAKGNHGKRVQGGAVFGAEVGQTDKLATLWVYGGT